MKRVMLFLAGCLFAASIALNIHFWCGARVPGKAAKTQRVDKKKSKPAGLFALPRKKTPANFFFRGAEYPEWGSEKKIEISFALSPVSGEEDEDADDPCP